MIPESIGLYIHIPFCESKCGYCDFNSYAGHDQMIPAYTSALLTEAALWSRAVRDRPVETVFLGGGTPSLNPVEEMERLLRGVRDTFDVLPDAEISLEANPGSIAVSYLEGLRRVGFNRVSIGVQSFDDEELKALGRLHSAEEATAAYAAARSAGFDNVNLDLIYGLPEQSLDAWQRSLERATDLAPEHLSLYALTVEDGTPLARDVARGRSSAPDPDLQADHYEWAMERMAATGFEHYEISNWARAGFACRHNLIYWQAREYLGLGAGAHSHLGGHRFSTVLLPTRYIELVGESARPDEQGRTSMRHLIEGEQVTPAMAMADAAILGLRLSEGVDEAAFARRFGRTIDEAYGAVIAEFTGHGIVERADGRLRLTSKGRLLSNELFARMLPEEAA